MKIIGVSYEGHTFGERGDAKMVVYFKLDVPEVPGVNIFEMAHYATQEKYDALRKNGIRLDCKCLTYTPRFNGFDESELDLLSLEQIVKLIQDWEGEVQTVVQDGQKMHALKQRAEAHHLDCFISTRTMADGGRRVTLKMEPRDACGTNNSLYLSPRPYWLERNTRLGYIQKEFTLLDLDELDDKYLDGLEEHLAGCYNKVMLWYEVQNILNDKFAPIRQLVGYMSNVQFDGEDNAHWETTDFPVFKIWDGKNWQKILVDKTRPIGSAMEFDAEHFSRTVSGYDIASIEAERRESEQRVLAEKKARNANRRNTEKLKKEKAQEWVALCQQAKKDWSPVTVERKYRS